jgi:hypothetical protein
MRTKQERFVKAYGAFILSSAVLAGVYAWLGTLGSGVPLATLFSDALGYVILMVMFTFPFAAALHTWFRTEAYE